MSMFKMAGVAAISAMTGTTYAQENEALFEQAIEASKEQGYLDAVFQMDRAAERAQYF
jgi:hypothetical protein